MVSRWVFSNFLATPWTVAHQTPLSMGFPRQEYEWVAVFFSRGSSWSRDQTLISCIGRRILYDWATWEAPHIQLGGIKLFFSTFNITALAVFFLNIYTFWYMGSNCFALTTKYLIFKAVNINNFWVKLPTDKNRAISFSLFHCLSIHEVFNVLPIQEECY